MQFLTINEAKKNLDKCILMLVRQEVDYFIVTQNGVPIVKIAPFIERKERRIGIAKGLWRDVSENEFNTFDNEKLMNGKWTKKEKPL